MSPRIRPCGDAIVAVPLSGLSGSSAVRQPDSNAESLSGAILFALGRNEGRYINGQYTLSMEMPDVNAWCFASSSVYELSDVH